MYAPKPAVDCWLRYPHGRGDRYAEFADGGNLGFGTTRLFNAACEPEIVDLANFLNALGAK